MAIKVGDILVRRDPFRSPLADLNKSEQFRVLGLSWDTTEVDLSVVIVSLATGKVSYFEKLRHYTILQTAEEYTAEKVMGPH